MAGRRDRWLSRLVVVALAAVLGGVLGGVAAGTYRPATGSQATWADGSGGKTCIGVDHPDRPPTPWIWPDDDDCATP